MEVNINDTPKDPERNGGLKMGKTVSLPECIKWGGKIKDTGWTVDQMCGGKNGITPKVFWDMTCKEKGTGYLKDMSIFPFSHPVLLWSVRAATFVNYAVLGEKGAKVVVKVFSSIIRVKDLNGCIKLVSNISMELEEGSGDICFIL